MDTNNEELETQEVSQNTQSTINDASDILDDDFDAWYDRMISGKDTEEENFEQDSIEQPVNSEFNESSNNIEEISNEQELSNDNNELSTIEEYIGEENSNEEEEELFDIKANGQIQKYSLEELKQLAPKALDYTKKMQELSPYRKIINAMKENDITAEDINQLIDIKKGNTNAKKDFYNKHNLSEVQTSMYGEDNSTPYKANDYGTEVTEVGEIFDDFKYDPYFEKFKHIVYDLDDASKIMITKDPSLLRSIMYELKSGAYDYVNPEVKKMKLLNPNDNRSYLDRYLEASKKIARRYKLGQQNQQINPMLNEKRKAASLTGNKNIVQTSSKNIKSTEDISDAELDAFLDNLGFSR